MNTIVPSDEVQGSQNVKPGMQLALAREKKGYTLEYVASKLHLRVKTVELLESDGYQQMPEAVFIKGYLRAYAKLLDIAPEPLLASFNEMYTSRQSEKTLWQSRRQSHYGESLVRWLTAILAVAVIVIIGIWWQKNQEPQLPMAISSEVEHSNETAVKLTDLSKMHNMFFSTPENKLH